jgi:hypothetical protein
MQCIDSGPGPTLGEAGNQQVGPTSTFSTQFFRNVTSMVEAIVQFCQQTDAPSRLPRHAIVCLLADEALW